MILLRYDVSNSSADIFRAVLHKHTKLVSKFEGNIWVVIGALFHKKENLEIAQKEIESRFKMNDEGLMEDNG